MKKILIVIIAIAILLTIPPYFVGSKAEDHFNKLMTMSKQNPNYKINIIEYNRGWFSSTAKVDFELTLDLGPEVPVLPKILFVQEMQHGPVLWKSGALGLGLVDSKFTIELPEAWQSELDKFEAIDKNTFKATSRTSFDGSTKSYLEMATITFNEDNISVNINPAKANFFYDLSGQITGDLDWEGMSVNKKDDTLLMIGKFHAESEQQLIRGDLFSLNAVYSGTFNSVFKRIEINNESLNQTFKLSDLGIGASSKVHDESIDVNTLFTIATMEGMNQKFTDMIYDFSVLNIDINVMLEFNELLMEMQQKIQQDPTLAGPTMFSDMQKLIPKFLAAEPILKINSLGVNTDNGRIDTKAKLIINPEYYDENNIESLMLALEVEASGQAPEAFFENFGFKLAVDQLVQQKMLIREDKNLIFQFGFKQGAATVNGNPIPMNGM